MRPPLLDRDELLARQAFQLALVDLFRTMARPDDIMAAAAAALGSHLDVARCGYDEVSADGAMTQGVGDWSNGTLPGLAATPDGDRDGDGDGGTGTGTRHWARAWSPICGAGTR